MGSEFDRILDFAHSCERNGSLAEIHSEIAHSFEIVVDLERGDDQADVGIKEVPLAQQSDGMLVDNDFHLVDARLG